MERCSSAADSDGVFGTHPSREGGFELGDGHRPGAVEPAQAGAELSLPFEVEDGAALGDLLGEAERHRLALRIGLHPLGGEGLARDARLGPSQIQLDGVQHDLLARAGER